MVKITIFSRVSNQSIDLTHRIAEVIEVGRDFFEIRDKRVSRKHGLITVCPLGIKIKACHVNPIFYKLKPEFQTQILSQNSADIALGNSDRFSLLPNEFEFEVKIIDDNSVASNEISIASTMRRDANQNNSDPERTPSPNSLAAQLISEEMTSDQDSNNRVAIKRSSNEPTECDNNSKKIKTSSELSVNNPAALSNPALPSISPTEALPITALTIKPDPDAKTSPTTSSTPATSSNITIKPDPDANETPSTTSLPAISINIAVKPDSDASPAEPANTRESCQYGIRCYRQTVDHRDAMAHPLDLDYRRPHYPAPPTDSPDCPFGAACYRRNVEHFQRLNHPPSNQYLPQPPQAPPRVVPVVPQRVVPLVPQIVANLPVDDGHVSAEEESGDEMIEEDFDDSEEDHDFEVHDDDGISTGSENIGDEEDNLEE